MATLILGIYNILANILVWPFCIFFNNHSNFKNTLMQRLALKLPVVPHGELIWFHASSLGEVNAISTLIEIVKSKQPDCSICLSSMTATGRKAASMIKGVDLVLPMPFDLSWIMRRYIEHLQPKVLVIVETEIWPNLLMQAKKAKVKTLFINARVSPKSFNRYKMIKSLMTNILDNARILAVSAEDAGRYAALGAKQVEVFGNLKFDNMQTINPDKKIHIRRMLYCGDRPVFIAGSTREGEERFVIEAIRDARTRIPRMFSIVAPRHPQSIPLFIDLAKSFGITWALRTKPAQDADLLLVDTMGELSDFYAVAQAAFVGGSLVPAGGQNILEPIARNVPTIHGPHMENFLWALDVVKGHTIVVKDAVELGRAIVDVLTEPQRYREMSKSAGESLLQAQGISMRYISAILK
ncbi:MAG: 3-deoxy-D-manno-octulosonic acid transferase [Smithella sp.]|nr:3-deoxy-D-manno-octulosonic acid transferase [Smithella sp.]